ncbi:MAG: ribonuclease Y [Deltaproteobacteria bacterium]|nr:ribonuclease Y [Deltaproteobacteria bacterium]
MAASDVILALLALVAGAAAGAFAYGLRTRLLLGSLKEQGDRIRSEAERERERLLKDAELSAKETLLETEREAERRVKKQRENLVASEKRLRQRETNVERKNELLERRERDLKKHEAGVDLLKDDAQKLLADAKERLQQATSELERVAGLSKNEARERLQQAMEDEARKVAAVTIARVEEDSRREADLRAKNILATAILRLAGDFVSEKTVSVVELPSDDMKGRIIGREGRNIRALEAATGVDVIIDDTPEAVILSGFNPVRREVAKKALERLVADGRIHPARIEEVVAKVSEEMDAAIQRAGEQATFDLGVHGVHPELVKLIGKLKYRTAGGYNLWNHSIETATIAGMLAAELGVNPGLAKRAGLLHDIGKVVDHESEGHHAVVGAEQARRFGEKPNIVEAIRLHHADEATSLLAVIVQAANRLSNARPGARKDSLDTYVKRLEDLERISLSFKGVQKAYAIQSGREVRVLVDYQSVNDDQALTLSQDIARRIQDELTYPGEVRVTVLREARATEVAR